MSGEQGMPSARSLRRYAYQKATGTADPIYKGANLDARTYTTYVYSEYIIPQSEQVRKHVQQMLKLGMHAGLAGSYLSPHPVCSKFKQEHVELLVKLACDNVWDILPGCV